MLANTRKNAMPALYRIRVKRPDLEVEVESTDREYVDVKLDHYLNVQSSIVPAVTGGHAVPQKPRLAHRPLSISEFVKQINPSKKNEVAAAIAYFLEYYADPILQEWKPDQIADRFPDVRKPKPANMTDLLVKSNFFISDKGSYRLSETGVDWVEAQAANHEG
jgi:hypothetical protein